MGRVHATGALVREQKGLAEETNRVQAQVGSIICYGDDLGLAQTFSPAVPRMPNWIHFCQSARAAGIAETTTLDAQRAFGRFTGWLMHKAEVKNKLMASKGKLCPAFCSYTITTTKATAKRNSQL